MLLRKSKDKFKTTRLAEPKQQHLSGQSIVLCIVVADSTWVALDPMNHRTDPNVCESNLSRLHTNTNGIKSDTTSAPMSAIPWFLRRCIAKRCTLNCLSRENDVTEGCYWTIVVNNLLSLNLKQVPLIWELSTETVQKSYSNA